MSPFVTIRVGTKATGRATHFFVQQDVLCMTSVYMQTKMKPEWSRREAFVDLPETTPQAFQLYVDWLYHGPISPLRYAALTETSKAYFVLGTAYLLGEEIQDGHFRDAVIDTLYLRCFPTESPLNVAWVVDIVTVIYSGAMDHTGGRQFITDMIISKDLDGELWDFSDDLPNGFFRDLARKYYSPTERMQVTERWNFPRCEYRCHNAHTDCKGLTPRPQEVTEEETIDKEEMSQPGAKRFMTMRSVWHSQLDEALPFA